MITVNIIRQVIIVFLVAWALLKVWPWLLNVASESSLLLANNDLGQGNGNQGADEHQEMLSSLPHIRELHLDRHGLLSTRFLGLASSMSESELIGSTTCSFVNTKCQDELIEIRIVQRFIKSDDKVLELGARNAALTCHLAVVQNNKGHVVAVEADPEIWWVILRNQLRHRCSFTLLMGAVSSAPLELHRDHLTGERSIRPATTTSTMKTVRTLSLMRLQSLTRLEFSAVLIHCDACAHHFLTENLDLMDKIRVIIIEGDNDITQNCHNSDCTRLKNAVEALMERHDFKMVHVQSEQEYFQWIPSKIVYHYVLIRPKQ